MGSSGAVLILVMLFMAVTSAASGEQIAVSSLFAFDVYRTYVNPAATGEKIVSVSRWAILVFGMLMGPLAVLLNHIGLSLGWLYLFMGVMIGAAVFPIAFAISWLRCSATAAIAGAVGGTGLGVLAWLAAGSAKGGPLTLASLGTDDVMLVGNLVSLLSSGLICTIVSLRWPAELTWSQTTMRIQLVEHDPNAFPSAETLILLAAAMKKIVIWGVSLAVVFVIIWPVLTLAAGSFSLPFFEFWVILSIVWGLVASAVIICLPIWEYRTTLISSILWMWRTVQHTASSRPAVPSQPEENPSEVAIADVSELLPEESGDVTVDTRPLVPGV
jgi:hypothetical protein